MAIVALCLGYHWLDSLVFMIAVIVAVVPEGSDSLMLNFKLVTIPYSMP